MTDEPFPASYSDRVRKIGVVNTKNKVITAIAAAMMDGPAALRRYMIDTFIVEGFTFDDVMNDDEALEAFVRKAAIGVWHASCSCRMGRADDPMAVVDTPGPRQGRAGPARGRCLDLPGGAVRQHQFPDADDGGEDCGHHDSFVGWAKALLRRAHLQAPCSRRWARFRLRSLSYGGPGSLSPPYAAWLRVDEIERILAAPRARWTARENAPCTSG